MSDPRYEELARRILEEPTTTWPKELQAMRPAKKAMPEALRLQLQALNEAALQNAEQATAKDSQKVVPFARRIIAFRTLSAAAAILIVGVAFFYSRTSTSNTIEATVSYVEGSVLVNEELAKAGSSLSEEATVHVAPHGLARIEAQMSSRMASFRLHDAASLLFERLRSDAIRLRLENGTVLASFHAISAERASLSILTSTGQADVTGTVFSVERDAKQARLTTYEGTVNYRHRWTDLEDLPEALFEQSDVLTEARQVLLGATASVGAEKESIITDADFNARLTQVALLKKALDRPAVAALRKKESPNPDELRAALSAIDEALASQSKEAIIATVQLAFGRPPEVRSVQAEELQERRQNMQALSAAERDARFKEMTSKGQLDKEAFRKEATALLGKAPQEIILTSGEHLYGTVFGEDGQYKVYTAEGMRVIRPEEIEEILFE